jgi:hypothetical protein
MRIEKIEYHGWPNCYQISNGRIELVVTTDVGPRIIRFGFPGEPNEFKEYSEEAGLTGGDTFRLYGGHRLWHAPEDVLRTYFPDNAPVTAKIYAKYLKVTQPVESTTGIQKEMEIRMHPDQAQVEVTHRLTNRNLWDVEIAAWSLSVMDSGGVAILPLPPRGVHPQDLLPSSTLILWPFTDLSDPRWTIGQRYILFRQNPRWTVAQKIGASVPDGWAAYARAGHLFVKQFTYFADLPYPDLGSCVELFNRQEMAEVETLGPSLVIAPGETVEHIERWSLFRDVPQPDSEADVEKFIAPLIVG